MLLQSIKRSISLESPIVMGILNATPDSFFEGSRVFSLNAVVDKAGEMLQQGATILDIGGQSTRPGSIQVGSQEEINRIYPVIEIIRKHFPDCLISVDTYYSDVIKQVGSLDIDIVNDISSGDDDPNMLPTVAAGGWYYIAMHKKGNPTTMQQNPSYLKPITEEVHDYFSTKSNEFADAGILNWALDPGFGFGKTLAHNYELMHHFHQLHSFQRPILIGISRKSMIYKLLNTSADDALNGSTALHMYALNHGAHILRVHDVKEAMETIQIFNEIHRR